MKDLKVEVFEPLQVAAIMAKLPLQVAAIMTKLPSTWNDYRKKLLYTSKDFTIEQLLKHIQIEEEIRIYEKKSI